MHLAQFFGFPAFVLLSISHAPGGHSQSVNTMAAQVHYVPNLHGRSRIYHQGGEAGNFEAA
jgi:hypothetical protein